MGVPLQPRELLARLKRTGLFLLPEDRDAALVNLVAKDIDTEAAMCADVASLAASHLVASSKWTQYVDVRCCQLQAWLVCMSAMFHLSVACCALPWRHVHRSS